MTAAPSKLAKVAPRPLDRRLRAHRLVVAIASELERQGITPRAALVFKIARAAGATFRQAAGFRWLADRRTGPRRFPPRMERERARRLVIAVYKALERVEGRGRGIVAQARRAARAGATFGDHDATFWLYRFVRPKADGQTENLRQYRATRRALLLLAGCGSNAREMQA